MKKCLKVLSTLVIAAICVFSLSACSYDDIDVLHKVVGDKMPVVKASYKIDSGMSAVEMYEAGVKNYEALPYAAGYQTGNVETRLGALGTTTQGIISRRVADDNYGSYIDSYSYTIKSIMGIKVKIMDEAVIDAKGVRMRSAKDVEIVDNNLIAKSWNDPKNYDSKNALLIDNPNDPTRINMLIVNSGTVMSMTEPEYDKKLKQYSFSLELKPVEGTKDYIGMMKKLVEKGGINNPVVNFNFMKLNVVMWDNGLIRSIETNEGYGLQGNMIISINGSATSTTITNYTYDSSEMKYTDMRKF